MAWSSWARVASILVFSISAIAGASSAAVTEEEAVRLFLESSLQAQRGAAIVRSVDAAARLGTRMANPDVTYAVEDAGGVRDEFLTVQQELPISGRRGLLRDRAEAVGSVAGLVETRELQVAAAELQASFYEILYRESVLEQLRRGTRPLEQMVASLAQREREGEGSGYDLLRAEQELSRIELAGAEAEVELVVARSWFGSFYDPAARMEQAVLDGDLRPLEETPQADEAVIRALALRADLLALTTDATRLDLERRAVRRLRLPEPILTAGWKRTETLGVGSNGFVASVSIPLPLFDRGGLNVERVSADRERVEIDTRIREREIRAEVLAAVARERASRQAVERHGNDVERRAGELRVIARLAYDEGEGGMLDLIDAHRTSLAMELRALALRYEVKRAEIERNLAIGIEVNP